MNSGLICFHFLFRIYYLSFNSLLWSAPFLKVFPETMEYKWMWLLEWQKSNSQLRSYTSLTNYSTPKNVLDVAPWRNTHSADCSNTAKTDFDNIYAYDSFRESIVTQCMRGKGKSVLRHSYPECINQHCPQGLTHSTLKYSKYCQEFQVMPFISAPSYTKHTAIIHI